MTTDEEDSLELLELWMVKTVLVLNKASVVWRFCEVPYIGVRSLRSGNVYRYANGSVTIWDHRLQMWIARPKRYHAHEADTEILLRLIRPHHLAWVKAFKTKRCRASAKQTGSDKLS
ncbi:hypothetical protein MHU86_2683 [Fragilaria crotonensis]|nr:hypothetical protein MHU86_2683 [Fragilaria crotonensis]